MDDFRIEKIGILTLRIDPDMIPTESYRWVKYQPPEGTLEALKGCDRFEIEIVPFSIKDDLNGENVEP